MAGSVSVQINSRDTDRAPYRLSKKISNDSPLNDFLCCNCFFPVVSARQAIGCGCRICEECFLQFREINGSNSEMKCRKCHLMFDINQTFRDKASDNELKRKLFPCFNLECPKQISAFEYKGHIANCAYADLKCINLGCNKTMPKHELKKHEATCQFRNILCQWCSKKIQANNKKRHEIDDCQEYLMNCPSGCGESMIRKNIREHIDHSCKKQTRLCPFMRYGCSTKGRFDVLEKHKKENVVEHLEMVAKAISENCILLHNDSGSAVGGTMDTRKLSKLQGEVNMVSSDMRSQLSRINETTRDLNNMMSDMQIHVQELSILVQTLQATSYNGQFIWKIPDLNRRRDEAVMGKTVSLYSAPFFTSRFGYKLCLRLYLGGDGSGKHTHISFFVTVMKGEYDALLPWPFLHMVTLTLLDQNKKKDITQCFKPEPSSSSFWKPHTEMNVASGCPKFAPISVLSDPNYVQEDTIFFKASVDTTAFSQP